MFPMITELYACHVSLKQVKLPWCHIAIETSLLPLIHYHRLMILAGDTTIKNALTVAKYVFVQDNH